MRWHLVVVILFGVVCYFSYDEIRWLAQAAKVQGQVQDVMDEQRERRGRRGRKRMETVRVVQCTYELPDQGLQSGKFETSTKVQVTAGEAVQLQVLPHVPPTIRLARSISVWPFLGLLVILGYWGWTISRLASTETMPQYDDEGSVIPGTRERIRNSVPNRRKSRLASLDSPLRRGER